MKKLFLVFAVPIFSSGCITLDSRYVQDKVKVESIGRTGCYPEEMIVKRINAQLGLTTWEVGCGADVFLCSATPGQHDDRVACHLRASEAKPVAATAGAQP